MLGCMVSICGTQAIVRTVRYTGNSVQFLDFHPLEPVPHRGYISGDGNTF